MLKQLLAQQLLDCILIDVKTHFKSRMAKLAAVLLEGTDEDPESVVNKKFTCAEKREVCSVAAKVYAGSPSCQS